MDFSKEELRLLNVGLCAYVAARQDVIELVNGSGEFARADRERIVQLALDEIETACKLQVRVVNQLTAMGTTKS